MRLFAGSTETSIEHFEKSLRLDPRTPLRHFYDTGLGACYFLQRRFDEAAPLLAESLRQVPTYVTTSYFLASCYAHMERLEDARGILDHLRSIGSPLMPPPELGLRDPAQREFWVCDARRADRDRRQVRRNLTVASFVATGGLVLSETEVSQSCRDMELHSVRCCSDQIEASKTVVPKVAFGSDFTQAGWAPMEPTRFQSTVVGKGKEVPKPVLSQIHLMTVAPRERTLVGKWQKRAKTGLMRRSKR